MNYGKSLCILCDQLLADSSMVAHPNHCPTHHFHCQCLVKHARRSRECPIDQIHFETVVCANGLPITFTSAQRAAVSKTPSKPDGGKQQEASPSRELVNKDNSPVKSGSKIMIRSDSPSQTPFDSLMQDFSSMMQRDGVGMMCGLCGKTIGMTEMASPDSCTHWFHISCLDSYTDRCNLCPFEGCYKEIESFSTSEGRRVGIRVSESRDYRNMVTAPENFICSVCNQVELQKNRAAAKPCGHLLHRSCLIDYVRQHKQCPVCDDPTCTIECDTAGVLFFP